MKSKTNAKKVALGMSGGVDSSVCAHLLKEQGYDVTGVYLECWRAPGCRTDQDRKDALQVALSLDIPYKVIDLKQAYYDRVVQYFYDEYAAGRTPNPDVLCNKEIKFGLFYDWAMENDFDYVATGHYASINQSGEKERLQIPKDTHKDQTYFLYLLTEDHLSHTLFPLQNMTKQEVRVEAQRRDIHVQNKKDSVGICFIGDVNVSELLKKELGEKPGDVVDVHENVIGNHRGLWFYTVGQRHGFEIDKTTTILNEAGEKVEKTNMPPFYVIEKRAEKNQLVVGFGKQTYRSSFKVDKPHWISTEPNDLSDLLVRIRHTGELHQCSLQANEHTWTVQLGSEIKGIAAGQSAVLYQQEGDHTICLGGAVIR